MDESYITIEQNNLLYENVIKKSRFIVQIQRVKSEDEAKNFIQLIQKNNTRANHNVWAYVLGIHSEIQRASDDGEPSGTAGLPMLEVLNNNQLRNVVVVQSRYFGGIKLGAGGLIRAYAGNLADAILSSGLVQKNLKQEIVVQIDYSQFERVRYWLIENNFVISETSFFEQVMLIVLIDIDKFSSIVNTLQELTCGQVNISKRDVVWCEIPLKKNIKSQTETRY